MPLPAHEPNPSNRQQRYTPLQVGRYVLGVSFLRNIFMACLMVACVFPLLNWFYLTPAYRLLLKRFSEDMAQRTALHLVHAFDIGHRSLGAIAAQAHTQAVAAQLKEDFQLDKIKLFDASGRVIFSTDPNDVGSVNAHPYFIQKVANGEIYSQQVSKGERSLENQPVKLDVMETYVPIMAHGDFLGAFEIYYDITAPKTYLGNLMMRSNLMGVLISISIVLIAVIILFKAGQTILAHRAMDQVLQNSREDLEKSVDERTADLIHSNKELQLEITQRKQAEKALLDNVKFMNTLIDTIPNPVFFKDDEGVFLGCNSAYNETLGLTKNDIIGRRLVDLDNITFHDMAETYHHQDLELIQSPGIRIQEQRLLSAQGELRDYMLFKAAFRDTEGQVAGLVGIMLDITARKKVEKELKESKNLFDAFMRHLPGPAFMKDLQGHYMFANHAFSNLTGISTDALIGLCDHQVWDPQTAAQLQANEQSVLESRSAGNNLETIQLADHLTRYLLTTRFPIYQNDILTALGGIAIDVTEQTETEARRRQLERQLLQAQKMEALGTLAGGIAHDFNNILSGIIGYTQIALSEIEKESVLYGYLKRVLDAGERAGDLVKQILTFSRQSDIEPTAVQIKIIVKEVLKLVRSTLPVTIEIVQQIKSEGFVMADPVQIHQVMMNLCANAGYAMRAKGGKLCVSLEDVTLDETFTHQYTNLRPGPYLKLSVIDTGRGIAPDHLQRIFDPFFTTKPKGEGTGMGLSVVHGIVTSLGGVITVHSAPGQGALFDIYLPSLQDLPVPSKIKGQALPTGKERILFVDDEVFQTDMLKHMLGLLGYKVQAFNRPGDALALFEKDPHAFDLMITDMVMPEMTGDDLSRRMLHMRPDLPIIMCTGYSENISEEKAVDIGIRAFVLKPISMDDLARLIREVLDKDDKR